MKKLFISVPMKGRTDEAIKASIEKMHKIAEATVGEELEVIPSFIEGEPPKDAREGVWYLGKSIQMLAEADYMAITDLYYSFKGCEIENDVARSYGIKQIIASLEFVAPDVCERMAGTCTESSCEVRA